MDITLPIDKSKIMPEVYRITGYTGAKANDIESISSSEDESDILDRFYLDAMNALSDVISRAGYLGAGDTVVLELPANWNSNMRKSLESAIEQYMINFVCMQWFNLSKKDEIARYSDLCVSLSVSIKKYINERSKPKRK